MNDTAIRQTALHAAHVRAGGRLVDFAGWSMPVQYSGLIDEHLAVRKQAGLFDVSHMGEARITGGEALALLQRVTCNNVAKLTPGRAQYTAITTPEGCFVDDLLIYRLDEHDFLLVLNASNTAKDLAWLIEQSSGFDARVDDVSADWALLALQGPQAVSVLQPHVEIELASARPFSVHRSSVAGAAGILARTGYTGEDGFEIFVPPAQAEAVWNVLIETGAPAGLKPAGLGARDTLRLEARLALYGNDIDGTTTVLEADLGWIVKLKKGEFIGRDVLARQRELGVERMLVGFEMDGRAIARHGYPALRDGEAVGRVTSGSFAPFLKKNIGLAYLPQGMWEPGTGFEVEIRGRREAARVVPTPFYKRAD